jgi:hypothetical protein
MKPETKSKLVGTALGAPIGVLLVCLSSPLATDIWAFAAQVALPRLTPQGHLSLLAILVTGWIVLGSLLYRASSKSWLIRKYRHIEDRGFWVDRKTGKQRVCGNCLLEGIVSPITPYSFEEGREHTNRWTCGRKECGQKYPARNEDFNQEAQPARSNQQPPPLPFSERLGDSLLPGSPAAVAERGH